MSLVLSEWSDLVLPFVTSLKTLANARVSLVTLITFK